MLKKVRMFLKWLAHRVLFTYRTLLGKFYAPIAVYSIAKTGTSSIKVTLRKQLPNPVHHTHHLSAKHFASKGLHTVNAHKDAWLAQLISRSQGGRWKVITLTRDPVARAISNRFEGLENLYFATDKRVSQIETLGFLHEQARDLSDSMFSSPDKWFDEELKSVFGFDIYAADCDPQQGYAIYQAEHADILLLRLEDLSRVGEQALAEFFDAQDIALLKSNERATTVLDEEYRSIKRTIKFSMEFLDTLYGMRYARHFYTAEEIDAFKARWGQLQ